MGQKVCVIVGGGKGMGAAVAREMHNRNYNLALMSPSNNCEILAKELNGIALRGKAENKSDTENLINLAMEQYGIMIIIGQKGLLIMMRMPIQMEL